MDRIVVGVDGSVGSDRVLAWAVDVARPGGATVAAVHAWNPALLGDVYGVAMVNPNDLEEAAEATLDECVDRVDVSGLAEPVDRLLVIGSPATALTAAAKDADVVVVGTRGRGGFAGLLLGSVSHQVLQQSPRPVVVVPHSWDRAPKHRIVVGVDGSDGARAAPRWAIEWARPDPVDIDVVLAFDPELAWIDVGSRYEKQWVEHATQQAERVLHDAVDGVSALAAGLTVKAIAVEGGAARVLVDRAERADLVVVGSRGRGGFAGLLLGSVSQRCAEHASCPVVVVPTRT